MTKEQKKLFDLFVEIKEICDRHNIVYYMAGGTLIGAIRHRGFLPWDDDMDLLMTRSNWERFIEVCKTELPENRKLECQELDRSFPNMFARYTDTSTAAIHKNQVLGDGAAGYIVDILILDPVPDKEESYRRYERDMMLYSDLVNPYLNYSYRFAINQDRYKEYYARMQNEGRENVLEELERSMFSYKEEECNYYIMRWGGCSFIFDKDMYGSSRYATFEGLKVRVPDRTGDYLVWHYGDDWMYIPPHSGREGHDAIFSMTTDYKTIQNDYMKYIDVNAVREAVLKRKLFYLDNSVERHYLLDCQAEIMATTVQMDVEAAISEYGHSLRESLEKGHYDDLNNLFSVFIKKQFSKELAGREDYLGIARFKNPIYCRINDEALYVVVMLLIHTSRIAKAARLLDIREQVVGPLTEELQGARNLIQKYREAVSCEDLGDHERAFAMAKDLFEAYPRNDNFRMFYLSLLLERGELDAVRTLSRESLQIFPRNGVYHGYIGDTLIDSDPWAAMEEYSLALNNTNNGLTILHIGDVINDKKDTLLADANTAEDFPRRELITEMLRKVEGEVNA